ncbi:MAG: NAD-binding protein [Desulfobacterales bacterium]|nr:NAD-binding protein [Desulfobacterales bacterium]MCF8078906.1 NAD-binding protein [Desulfobacterales bacterium]
MDYRKLRISLLLLLAILAFGTFGYSFFEGMTVFEAFYMTLITISTVGFGEIKPLTEVGRFITVVVIVTGISTGTYTIGMVARIFIEGELSKFFGRRRLEKQISELKDHFIICGYGRIGRIICRELHADAIPFVVIDEDPAAAEKIAEEGYLFLQRDATLEETLLAAGIESARGIVTVVSSDANNVYITLTARGLRPDIFVLARSSDVKNEEKLKRAGATRVVSPYMIGGRRMAQVLKRPTVVDFIDIATMESALGLMMEEARVGARSGLIGKNLIESHLRQDYGVIIVAIKKLTGEMIFNPVPTETLESGDVIVVLGKKEDLKRMRDIL